MVMYSPFVASPETSAKPVGAGTPPPPGGQGASTGNQADMPPWMQSLMGPQAPQAGGGLWAGGKGGITAGSGAVAHGTMLPLTGTMMPTDSISMPPGGQAGGPGGPSAIGTGGTSSEPITGTVAPKPGALLPDGPTSAGNPGVGMQLPSTTQQNNKSPFCSCG